MAMGGKEHLARALEHLIRIRNESSCAILSECGFPDITVKQARYLKTIDQQGDMTFTRLAEVTCNSKPTITEMINRFESMDCVFRERSPDDGRVLYIRLTDRGRMIARVDERALVQLIERMKNSLDEDELEMLVNLLKKVR
jgi:DNA-binding MarR family transcriptional regulator